MVTCFVRRQITGESLAKPGWRVLGAPCLALGADRVRRSLKTPSLECLFCAYPVLYKT